MTHLLVWEVRNCRDTPQFTFLYSLPSNVEYTPKERWVGTAFNIGGWDYLSPKVHSEIIFNPVVSLHLLQKNAILGCILPILVEE